MDLTMLRQACRRSRMAAALSDVTGHSNGTGALHDLLNDGDQRRKALPDTSQWMPDSTYGLLLHYLNANGQNQYDDARGSVHPARLGTMLLTQDAVPLAKLSHRDRDFSIYSQHEGNSHILFRSADGSTRSGTITEIWCKAVPPMPTNDIRTFVRIAAHLPLLPDDAAKDPFQHFPGFKRHMFYAVGSEYDVLIDKEDIIYTATLDFFAPGEFGIDAATMAVYFGVIQGRTIFR